MKKITFLIMILIALSTIPVRLEKVEAAARLLRVPQDYHTIQTAINASSSGDTITVASGVYNESPWMNEDLYRNNIAIIGQSSSNTVVTGSFELSWCTNVSLTSFEIKGQLIVGKDLSVMSKNVTVSNSILRKGVLFFTHSSTLRNNTIYGNVTIRPWGAVHDTADGNKIENNTIYDGGVILSVGSGAALGVSSNTITRNTIVKAPIGVLEEQYVYANSPSGRNNITENNLVQCGVGVKVDVVGTGGKPSYSVVSGNIIEQCGYGIVLSNVRNVSVFHNSFIDNTVQAWVNQSNLNSWDNGYPSGGNYWSDYSGTDFYHGPNQNLAGSDGIGDIPYVIGVNNTDRYPLMSFSDEFSSTSNGRWTWTNQPQSWYTSSGWLLITPTLGTNFWSGYDSGQFLYQWMSGNFMVETKVSVTLTSNYQQAGLMIRQDANNWAKTSFEYSDGLTVKTVVNRNNVANVGQVTSVPTGTTVVWLRVVRNGDSYTAYYGFDGSTWTQQYSGSQPSQGTLMVGLSVTDGDSRVAFQPSFDYFHYSNIPTSSYSIQTNGLTFPCSVQSNSLVSSLTFNQASKQIGFSVTGDAGTSGVCNVTIPTQLLGGTFTVLIDGSPRPATVTSDATHTSIFFTYSHSTHQVQIIGTSVVPEFPTVTANILVLAVLALMLLFLKRSHGARFRDGLI